MTKKFNYNDDLEKILTAIFGVVGMVAIFINLHLKGYGEENWLDAIKDVAGLIVVLAVFVASIRISSRSKTFSEVARVKLEGLRNKYQDFLIGPRYNREGYDPEKGQGLEYLFIRNSDLKSKQRAKFIPIQPLEEGVLIIYIQKGTLVYGLNYKSEDSTTEEIKKLQDEIEVAVVLLIQKRLSKKAYDILPNTKDDIAIIIDFDEVEIGKRKFAALVNDCVECAIKKLLENRRNLK
jgi:DNA-directed RNA polymerase subunit F